MKKILSILSLCLVAAVVTLQSCKKDDDPKPAPSITLSATAATGTPGSSVVVTATIEAGNGAKTLTVTGATATPASPISLSGTSVTQEVSLAIPATAVVGATISVVFIVTDNENFASAPATFTITVGNPVITLQGNLTTQTLDASKVYLLKSQVFIPDGVTLTIPAGTVIKGEKATKAALVVKPGGKLIANGTASNPVVFTSNQVPGERDKGDWAGVLVLGKAFVNQPGQVAIEGISPQVFYGARYADASAAVDFNTNATDNSGSLTYVRIEYAGIELTPNNETNSLTMGGVGNGTTIDYVQVSYGGDDGFEWFGGTVNCKHLISQASWDDDFDSDFGWSGKVQFGLILRYPFAADQSESNAFESDSQGNGNEIFSSGTTGTPWCTNTERGGCTSGVFSNVTVLGPRDITSTARPISGNFRNALHIRRRSNISIFNSYFSGFRLGLRVDDAGTLGNITSGNSVWANNILLVPGTVGAATNSTTPADAAFATGLTLADDGSATGAVAGNATFVRTTWEANNTFTLASPAWTLTENPYTALGLGLNWYWGGSGVNGYTAPNFAVTSGTLSSGASFTNAKLSGTFFETVTYRGAFGATNWTTGWAEFVPQNKVY
ncbi:MAG: hypothetical protein J0L66_06525 [Cytophagales bacterium]|nr:hypothetical protein [Cytophagales bacterium]